MLELNPEHISAYSLTIEEKTVFGNWQKTGKLNPMEDDLAAQQLEILVSILGDNGYEQYEVSNFAKPNFMAIHNTNYWKQKKYLGVGPSAHSFNGVSRQFNVSNNAKYLQAIESGMIPLTFEKLSREDRINEYVLTTLRTKWGSDLAWIKEEFAYDLLAKNSKYIEQLLHSELALLNDHYLILTKKGLMLGDKIASDLFVIA
jgi:oxygen-independent coproporphyrinogen-3 oxidase